MNEKYDPKLKTFPNHLLGVFKELGEEGHFADVTLVSDDQIQTKAHKVVLSACSPVLKTLLVNNPHSHPLLYLRGVKQTELKAVLNLMYFGETELAENRMNEFVSVVKDLKVKEISNLTEEKNVVNEMISNAEDLKPNTDKSNLSNVMLTKKTTMQKENTNADPACNLSNILTNVKPDTKKRENKQINRKLANSKRRYKCDKCESVFTLRYILKRHKQSTHEGITFNCTQCDFKTGRKDLLHRHFGRIHDKLKIMKTSH